MDRLRDQEVFEIEVLQWLKNKGFLESLIFGGGTMLRLCYNLNRYSFDLAFWTFRMKDTQSFYYLLKAKLSEDFELTDVSDKFFTLLFEIRKFGQQKKIKLEIRKSQKSFDYEYKIAFSRYSNIQVLVRVFTLEQMIKNKIEAFLSRKEIRDAYDLEFILKKGIEIPKGIKQKDLEEIKKIVKGFNKQNYKVNLGSMLDPEMRKYYIDNNFYYLLGKIDNRIDKNILY